MADKTLTMVKSEIQSIKLRFGIIGNTEGLNRAIDIAIQVAPTDLSVLVTGESGVGKESFPQIIHQFSRRKHGPYIAVNCGAIPEGTIDSELFGHEKGAFTGAISDRNGYFAEANGGTIFLDEVGELPLSTQARLLRVLESGEYIKVGSSKVQKTDVRIVAATNVNFAEAIAEGRFREDLYYRLNTVPIKVPPLRERPDDIALLFRKFAADFAEKYRMPSIQLNDEAKKMLVGYQWPGNIRQLKNITEQISIIETNRDITPEILATYLPDQNQSSRLPAFVGGKGGNGNSKSFESEREILYQVLFDMRRDVTELKKLVHEIMTERGNTQRPQQAADGQLHYFHNNSMPVVSDVSAVLQSVNDMASLQSIQQVDSVQSVQPIQSVPVQPVQPVQTVTPITNINHIGGTLTSVQPSASSANIQGVSNISNIQNVSVNRSKIADYQDTEEYVEENLSLDDVEREMIKKALERHHGRRKNAAKDLKISERTLYRKIKEYGLE